VENGGMHFILLTKTLSLGLPVYTCKTTFALSEQVLVFSTDISIFFRSKLLSLWKHLVL